MRPFIFCCFATVLLAAACRDSHAPEQVTPLQVSTNQASYTRSSGSSNILVEVGFRNTSTSTVWIESCGPGYSSLPGTSPVIAVYGTQVISYATTPPTVTDVGQLCSASPAPYALVPAMGVRMSVVMSQTGSFSFSAPFSGSANGSYEQRAISPAFTITQAP